MGRTLARGGHSLVSEARDVCSYEPLAVKCIRIPVDSDTSVGNLSGGLERELDVLCLVRSHACIPSVRGYMVDGDNGNYTTGIVLEYIPFPSLATYLSYVPKMSERATIFIVRQLLEAVTHLSDCCVVHRDIKPPNILINPDTRRIKLIDYGLAYIEKSPDFMDNIDNARSDAYVGTPIYMAPEVLRGGEAYNAFVAESWSVGCVMLELLLGYHIFRFPRAAADAKELKEMHRDINTYIFPLHNTFDRSCATLVSALMAYHPIRRHSPRRALRLLTALHGERRADSARERPPPSHAINNTEVIRCRRYTWPVLKNTQFHCLVVPVDATDSDGTERTIASRGIVRHMS